MSEVKKEKLELLFVADFEVGDEEGTKYKKGDKVSVDNRHSFDRFIRRGVAVDAKDKDAIPVRAWKAGKPLIPMSEPALDPDEVEDDPKAAKAKAKKRAAEAKNKDD